VTVERISPYIPSLAVRAPRPCTTSSGGASFATLLQEMPPTPEEIKSLAAYLEWRLATTFFAAMGDNYSTPLPIFMTPAVVQTPAPGSWDPLVASAAQEYGVDPRLIQAVIQAESAGNPHALSPRGAMGLMQLMPGTAKDLGVSDPFDPKENIRGGTRYLKSLLDRYQGNVELALAAYNWGPGNLERAHRSLPSETVSYIARIKRLLGEAA